MLLPTFLKFSEICNKGEHFWTLVNDELKQKSLLNLVVAKGTWKGSIFKQSIDFPKNLKTTIAPGIPQKKKVSTVYFAER